MKSEFWYVDSLYACIAKTQEVYTDLSHAYQAALTAHDGEVANHIKRVMAVLKLVEEV